MTTATRQTAEATSGYTATRSFALMVALGVVSALALAANIVGGLRFPPQAPEEDLLCFGITVDVAILVLILAVGILSPRTMRVSPDTRWALLGMCLTVVVLFGVALPWVSELTRQAADGTPLHYADLTSLAFIEAPLWVGGLALAAFAVRGSGGIRRTNAIAWIGVAAGVAVLVLCVVAADVYGSGLSA